MKGCGAGTFRPVLEQSEYFVPTRSRVKKFRLLLRKRGKIIKRKTQYVKRENAESIIFTAQILPFSPTGELESPQRGSTSIGCIAGRGSIN